MAVQAGQIINNVRDQIPDPVYSAGVPQPDADGGTYRASTLYRYLSDGITICSQKLHWTVIDWNAFPFVNLQSEYVLPSNYVTVRDMLGNKWVLARIEEQLTIYPSSQVTAKQPVWYGVHSRTNPLNIFIFPAPNFSDPSTTTTTNLAPTSTSVTVTSATGFLSDGYLIIGGTELVRYHSVDYATGVVSVMLRGQGGTIAGTFSSGATVQHCSGWFKGLRVPAPVTISTAIMELPDAFSPYLQDYVLARVRQAENEFQESARLMQQFQLWLKDTAEDPQWVTMNPSQLEEFGSPLVGGLAWGRVIVP